MAQLTVRMIGETPMLLHNVEGANPLNPSVIAKGEVSRKRKKTEEDHRELMRLEFIVGLYWDDAIGVHLPARSVRRMIRNSAALWRRGKDVERGVSVVQPMLSIHHEKLRNGKGPASPQALWERGLFDVRQVVNKGGGGTVMRTRPMIPAGWVVEPTLSYDDAMASRADLLLWLERAGQSIGIGDYRVERGGDFGRFTVEVVA